MTVLTITSFGYGHGEPPAATVTVDLRAILRDPHINPALRYMTAHDDEVRATVWRTPGATELLTDLVQLAATLRSLAERTGTPTSIAIGCAGGRHRAATFAMAIHEFLAKGGKPADLVHRDLHRDVIER